MIRVFVFLAALAACNCGSGASMSVECAQNSDCNLGPGGLCDVNTPTGNKWCTYPDTACEGGRRWSDFDVGDGVSGTCVINMADAGVGQGDASDNDACVPATCESLAANCGNVADDGCGGTLDCGICVYPLTCGAGGTDHVCGGSCVPSQWSWIFIANNIPDSSAYQSGDLKLGQDGRLHIVYKNRSPNGVLYSSRANDASPWSLGTSITETSLHSFDDPHVLTDSQGGVHVMYRSGGEPAPTHAFLAAPGGTWTINDSISAGFGSFVCAAIDSEDGLHLAFDQAGGLQYVYRPAGGAWTTPVLVEAGFPGQCDLDVDTTGAVHVVRRDNTSIRYSMRGVGGSWSTTEVATAGSWPAIVVDAKQTPHVTYYGANFGVTYAYRPGSSWLSEPVDSATAGAGNSTARSDVAVRGNVVHISYVALDGTTVKHAMGSFGTWQKTAVHSFDNVGRTSVQVDSNGGVHMMAVSEQAAGMEFEMQVKYGYRCP